MSEEKKSKPKKKFVSPPISNPVLTQDHLKQWWANQIKIANKPKTK